MSDFPEHDKLPGCPVPEHEAISGFVEWIQEHEDLCLAEWQYDERVNDHRLVGLQRSRKALIAEYFGIDLHLFDHEKRIMLARLRRNYGPPHEWRPEAEYDALDLLDSKGWVCLPDFTWVAPYPSPHDVSIYEESALDYLFHEYDYGYIIAHSPQRAYWERLAMQIRHKGPRP